MTARLVMLSAAAVAILVGTAQAQFKTPEAAVEGLYAIYNKPGSDGFSDRDAPRFLDVQLLKLWRAAKHKDSDFFIQGQDFELKDVKVAASTKVQGDRAEVIVTFRNFGEPSRLTYSLVKSTDDWRISDARSGKNTLRGALKTASKP